MKLAIIDFNRGQVPTRITYAIKLSDYNKKEIEEYLTNNDGAVIRTNYGGFVFGLCEKKYQSYIQNGINKNIGG